MKNPMINLGVLLLAILLAISIGSLALYFSNDTNNLFSIGLGTVFIIVAVTFVAYLLFDLYSTLQEDQELDYRASRKSVKQKEDQNCI